MHSPNSFLLIHFFILRHIFSASCPEVFPLLSFLLGMVVSLGSCFCVLSYIFSCLLTFSSESLFGFRGSIMQYMHEYIHEVSFCESCDAVYVHLSMLACQIQVIVMLNEGKNPQEQKIGFIQFTLHFSFTSRSSQIFYDAI